MTTVRLRLALLALFSLASRPSIAHADGPSRGTQAQAQDGSVEFVATTNLSALTIHGDSRAVRATAAVRREGARLVLQNLDARLPVAQLSTGMAVRDRHMRERIFAAQDGSFPDLTFVAEQAACEAGAPRCLVRGVLSIRGQARPFDAWLTLSSPTSDEIRVAGEGTVKLSDYGIERPRQFGVTVEDAVTIRFKLSGRATTVAAK
jgi:polyisoprenoid-binding protein YceI